MEHRIRVKRIRTDGTEFSIEVTGLHAELDSMIKDVFGSLKSFNAEMEKQDEKLSEAITKLKREYALKSYDQEEQAHFNRQKAAQGKSKEDAKDS